MENKLFLNAELKEMTLDQIKELRECLIARYIGDFNKPRQYYEQLQRLNDEIDGRLE